MSTESVGQLLSTVSSDNDSELCDHELEVVVGGVNSSMVANTNIPAPGGNTFIPGFPVPPPSRPVGYEPKPDIYDTLRS
jgi:hypothetical protein